MLQARQRRKSGCDAGRHGAGAHAVHEPRRLCGQAPRQWVRRVLTMLHRSGLLRDLSVSPSCLCTGPLCWKSCQQRGTHMSAHARLFWIWQGAQTAVSSRFYGKQFLCPCQACGASALLSLPAEGAISGSVQQRQGPEQGLPGPAGGGQGPLQGAAAGARHRAAGDGGGHAVGGLPTLRGSRQHARGAVWDWSRDWNTQRQCFSKGSGTLRAVLCR